MGFNRLVVLVGVLAISVTAALGASKRACKPSVCKPQILACKEACGTLSKKKRTRCRTRCTGSITRACRRDLQVCGNATGGGDDGGGGGGDGGGGTGTGQCVAYSSTCQAETVVDSTLDPAPICAIAAPSLPECTASFQSTLELWTPTKTTAGECCVVDTCAGKTAFGVYNLLGRTGLPNPPFTAPVLATLDYQSIYFERPPGNPFDPGQWQLTVGSGGSVQCVVDAPNILAAAGFRYNYRSGDLAGPYASRPSSTPEASWRTPWALSPDQATLSISGTAASPNDIVRPGGGKPHMWDLDPLLFSTQTNPPVEVLTERFSVDKVCRDEVIVSASGTFRRRDGSECSVNIYARASTRCDSTEQCLGGNQCIDGRCRLGLPNADPIGLR